MWHVAFCPRRGAEGGIRYFDETQDGKEMIMKEKEDWGMQHKLEVLASDWGRNNCLMPRRVVQSISYSVHIFLTSGNFLFDGCQTVV